MNAALRTDGKTTTQSALSSRAPGILSGMSRISLRTVPLFVSRSSSFSLSAAHPGVAANRTNVITTDVSFIFILAPSAPSGGYALPKGAMVDVVALFHRREVTRLRYLSLAWSELPGPDV